MTNSLTGCFLHMLGSEIKFRVGESHDSVYTLRNLLRDYAIQEGVSLDREKNDKDKLIYKCKGEDCPWRIYARVMIDQVTMKIKSYNDNHQCHRVYKNEEARVKWIAGKFEDLLKSNPDIKIGVIADMLREQFGVNVDQHRLYNAKRRALGILGREHEESFKWLRSYACMVNACNPGSAASIRLQQPHPTFQRFFLSFESQRKGFLEGCRPFIGVDGCHLKGPYKGVLLSAVALDANSGLYPLAVCICEGETILSWTWFLGCLKQFLNYLEDAPMCFMSDRQKGVLNAIAHHWLTTSIRYCARHIYANFRGKYSRQKLKSLFWQAAMSYDVHSFNRTMTEISLVDEDAKVWLSKIDSQHWCRFGFDNRIKCDHVTNNLTESFNNMLGDHRAKLYLALLEFIRRMVMQRFQMRREEANNWPGELPPTVNARMLIAMKQSRQLKMLKAGDDQFELLGPTRAYVAKLREFSCKCGEWQLSGIPCCHAMAGIGCVNVGISIKDKMANFIHPRLTKSAFLLTYNSMINPIPDKCTWDEQNLEPLLPPPVKRSAGRPKKLRRREIGEKAKGSRSSSVICTKCKTAGHNKRTCTNMETKGKKKKTQETGGASTMLTAVAADVSSSHPQTESQSQSHVDL